MYTFIVVLIIIVSLLLAMVVLVQNSKGGGLAANFSAPTQVLGARQTADFREKATWWLGGILVVLCMAATVSISGTRTSGADEMQTEVTSVSDLTPVQPAAPVAEPMAAEE